MPIPQFWIKTPHFKFRYAVPFKLQLPTLLTPVEMISPQIGGSGHVSVSLAEIAFPPGHVAKTGVRLSPNRRPFSLPASQRSSSALGCHADILAKLPEQNASQLATFREKRAVRHFM